MQRIYQQATKNGEEFQERKPQDISLCLGCTGGIAKVTVLPSKRAELLLQKHVAHVSRVSL